MKKTPVLSGKTGRAMPMGKPWKKGQSGNPGGRPKKFTTLISDAMRQEMGEVDVESGMTYASAMVTRVREILMGQLDRGQVTKECIWFLREVTDRTEGRPRQMLEIDDHRDRSADEVIDEILAAADSRAKGLDD